MTPSNGCTATSAGSPRQQFAGPRNPGVIGGVHLVMKTSLRLASRRRPDGARVARTPRLMNVCILADRLALSFAIPVGAATGGARSLARIGLTAAALLLQRRSLSDAPARIGCFMSSIHR